MDKSRLAPDSSLGGEKKQRAIQDAKQMYQEVLRNCERTKTAVPPYEFYELIGKGAFGRVYKCREKATGDLVAIKIVDTDEVDYHQDSLDKDDTIRDFRKEVTILQQLKDSNAKNVNLIHDAFDLQQQLWIVSDYCTGGSVRTLMRAQPATHPGLEEQFVVPIARELALAMKSVHDIGVIHRDIKCTNVYVTEEGEIQLGDFGIVGVLDDGVSKRQTMIGTPHYMPREMLIHGMGNQVAEAYGTEVDVWSFGCTVYEMATGQPPNAVKRQDTLRNELLVAPRLEGAEYSQGLRDFVAFCLNSDPSQRPTAEEVLQHPYVANTQKKYPTRKLIELIHRFKIWEYSGGVRQSLFVAGGALPVGFGDKAGAADEDELDEWNFSTSDSFNEAHEKRYSQMVFDHSLQNFGNDRGDATNLSPLITDLTPLERLRQQHKDLSANRGERSLERIFTAESEPYELHTPVEDPSPDHDLPFRKFSAGALTRESQISAPVRDSQIMIDLDTGDDEGLPTYNFDFGDGPTLKARSFHSSNQDDDEDEEYNYGESEEDRQKRVTMDWKFPTARPAQQRATMDWKFPTSAPRESEDPDMQTSLSGGENRLLAGSRPALKHSATEPLGHFMQNASSSPTRGSMTSMIDLDLGLSDLADLERPSTSHSATGSIMTDVTSGDPFDLEEEQARAEMDHNRFSYHKQWQSEGGQIKRASHRSIPMHTRGSSLSSTASDLDRPSTAESEDVFGLDYSQSIADPMRMQLNGALVDSRVQLDKWPDFGEDVGLDRARAYTDGLAETVRKQREIDAAREPRQPNGNTSRRPSAVQLEFDFPRIVGPHPDALREDADPKFVEAELARLLVDLGSGLEAVATALPHYADTKEEDENNERTLEGMRNGQRISA